MDFGEVEVFGVRDIIEDGDREKASAVEHIAVAMRTQSATVGSAARRLLVDVTMVLVNRFVMVNGNGMGREVGEDQYSGKRHPIRQAMYVQRSVQPRVQR